MIESERISTDVLIVGGGIVGCAGAIAAAEQGQRVVLVEKAWTGGSGATTFATGGFYWFDPERHSMQKILAASNKSSDSMFDPEWMEWFCHNIHDLILTLDGMGVPFRKEKNGDFVVRSSRGGTELVMVPGYILQKKMRSLVAKAGVQLVDRVMITKLLTAEGQVSGAVGFHVRTGKPYIVEAKNTVIVAGGCSFKGNFFGQDMLCGEGIRLAEDVGAEFTNMEAIPIILRRNISICMEWDFFPSMEPSLSTVPESISWSAMIRFIRTTACLIYCSAPWLRKYGKAEALFLSI